MLYNLLRVLLYIPIFIISVFKKKLRSFLTKRLFQDFKNIEMGDFIWVHCASVGEVNLSEGLVRKFLQDTDYKVIVTMMTDTGMSTALGKYKGEERVNLLYFPLDDLFSIKKILSKINLKVLVVVETEIWPNLIGEASKKGKVVFVNGRISDSSFSSYKMLSFYLKRIFSDVELFLMQTEEDRKRIIRLGALEKRVENVGNLKFDIDLPDFSNDEISQMKNQMGVEGKKIFTAGSTRNSEEEKVLELYNRLEGYFMFLVPRHIERSSEIEERLLKGKYKYEKWSTLKNRVGEATQILLVDQIGVLRKLYALCDIAFVGGTMVDIGGHSLIEPLYYRKPPVFGHYLQNVKEISREILRRGIGFKIENSSEFLEAVKRIEKKQVDILEIDKFFQENREITVSVCKRIIDII